MPQWTDQQREAIYTKGQDILIAAAAGSGKTAVLVERIIQKVIDTESPVNIDELMVATFTNAAAQEMRTRVQLALDVALEENPTSDHLKKQATLLQQASISTLHSFCLDLVKRYSYKLDIDPGFRIANDLEADLLRQEVLEDLFEYWYSEENDEQVAFFDVVDRFSSDRHDQDVESIILKLNDFAMKNPWPTEWLDEIASNYELNEGITNSPWFGIIVDKVTDTLEQAKKEAEKCHAITLLPDGPYHYGEAYDSDIAFVNKLIEANNRGWEALAEEILEVKFKALSRKKVECDPDLKAQFKEHRDRLKKLLTDLKNDYFTRTLADQEQDIQSMTQTAKTIVELVKAFQSGYQEKKKERGLVDFNDLEHFALAILIEKIPAGVEKTDVARQLEQKFTEVLIDEYQDTNMVQETILRAITKENPGNLFMVGDVKQSIYRFRHAEPSLFLNKFKTFKATETSGHRIDLAKNFRSRKQVLDATNFIFRQLLDETVGEMDYDDDSQLIYGNVNYDLQVKSDPEAELIIIDRAAQTGTDDDQDDLQKAELEARAYADKIKQWIGHGKKEATLVFDKDTLESRPCHYRDIVILLRSLTDAPVIMEELKNQGIPVYAELDTGYLEAIEIQVMLNVLKIIDNAKQDIPFASVLKSPIVGLNEEELTQIRLTNQKVSFYEATKHYTLEHSNDLTAKLQRFLEQFTDWRIQNRTLDLSALIWYIFRDTGYYDFVSGMPGGRQRQANLRALYDRARGYEETSFRGLYRFLRMIERMEERGEDLGAARALGEKEDVVRLMTIHKSKGLEFPMVILGAMDKQFNKQDLNAKYLLHKDFGFSSKYIDPNKRLMYPTLMYRAIREQMKKEQWAEEMRVLYVALTRAKEKLVMIGAVRDFSKKVKKYQEVITHDQDVLPAALRLESQSYLDWVAMSLVRHESGEVLRGDTPVQYSLKGDTSQFIVRQKNSGDYRIEERQKNRQAIDLFEHLTSQTPVDTTTKELDDLVSERLTYHYPHHMATTQQAKQSVTEIKRRQTEKDPYASDQFVRQLRPFKKERPLFMQKEKTLTKAETGTAMHTVMQHINFERQWDQISLVEYLAELEAKEILTHEQVDAIDVGDILRFLDQPVVSRMKEAEVLERETPFSYMVDISKVDPSWQGTQEDVFIQGVIDVLYKTTDGWEIFDYKTDTITGNVTNKVRQTLAERYRVQLDLYTEAIEAILLIKVHKRHLYFFNKDVLIEL
ncbi:ATP-dependent helicase/nuclease subunit A [Halolactibacillus miurensis]|uniref:ATP-dependent helicase/nuclease subunit A n=1 Tax=Halolactibacillus miurensis TaxID=306541 RepID=A0A1I6RG04_9BACI|nr:helicase-exonuclease AddAB subunit AddA [Halolactibacillus miurensis]GEM03874.1 ATP-dependent helicase/nuclease subunit A [Halolactibacillus miurensis]SFS63647.1 DNA helicase/exodeoxyribonuclease V, subunit A [Halolactibacillus miurensis]